MWDRRSVCWSGASCSPGTGNVLGLQAAGRGDPGEWAENQLWGSPAVVSMRIVEAAELIWASTEKAPVVVSVFRQVRL